MNQILVEKDSTVWHLLLLGVLVGLPAANVGGEPTREQIAVVPVFESGVERPFKVIGEIKDNLRKPFSFSPNPTREEILAEIWERGRKMGADAVINARFGPTKVTVFSYGRTPISGTAIKFTD